MRELLLVGWPRNVVIRCLICQQTVSETRNYSESVKKHSNYFALLKCLSNLRSRLIAYLMLIFQKLNGEEEKLKGSR